MKILLYFGVLCDKLIETIGNGGENMEQKILDILVQVQNHVMELQEQMGGLQNQVNGLQNQVNGLQDQVNGMESRLDNKIEEVRQEILDQQFLFEQEYGIKIDAIFDAVTMELDKNLEKSEKIRTLEKRADRHDAVMLGYEKRISKLELNR